MEVSLKPATHLGPSGTARQKLDGPVEAIELPVQ
jgi:hypothetical protein